MRVLFAGGGTGGHVYPSLAVAEELCGEERLFVGSRRGIEARIVRQAGLPYIGLPVEGFERRWTARNLAVAGRAAVALAEAGRVIREFEPDVVLGTGGFASAPPVVAAQVLGVPTVLQEQNAYPGATTRLLSWKAKEVLLAFDEAARYLPRRARRRARVTGNPVRKAILRDLEAVGTGARDRMRKGALAVWPDLSETDRTVLVFGGSQGSRAINEAVSAMVREMGSARDFQLLWSTGPAWKDEVTRALGRPSGPPVVVLPYVDRMAEAYAVADVAVCRAGALTCSELAAAGCPSILVPFRHAAGDHQRHNARAMERAGAAIVVEEDPGTTAGALADALRKILHDEESRARMARAARSLARPDAAREVAARLRKVAGSE